MNTSCGDTVKCRLDAGKSPIFQSQSPCTYIYTYRSRNGFGTSYVYIRTKVSTKWLNSSYIRTVNSSYELLFVFTSKDDK